MSKNRRARWYALHCVLWPLCRLLGHLRLLRRLLTWGTRCGALLALGIEI